jgi:hypothetical protein
MTSGAICIRNTRCSCALFNFISHFHAFFALLSFTFFPYLFAHVYFLCLFLYMISKEPYSSLFITGSCSQTMLLKCILNVQNKENLCLHAFVLLVVEVLQKFILLAFALVGHANILFLKM